MGKDPDHYFVSLFPRFKKGSLGLPWGAVVKNPPVNAGDMASIPGPGRSHMPWGN